MRISDWSSDVCSSDLRRACHGAGLGGDLSRGMRPGGPMDSGKFRLVTRSDFDGLASAVLLRDLDLIDDVRFVHPKDMQDGQIEIGARDIITNLPYVPGCHLCFDHHLSEELRVGANGAGAAGAGTGPGNGRDADRKSTRLNSSH